MSLRKKCVCRVKWMLCSHPRVVPFGFELGDLLLLLQQLLPAGIQLLGQCRKLLNRAKREGGDKERQNYRFSIYLGPKTNSKNELIHLVNVQWTASSTSPQMYSAKNSFHSKNPPIVPKKTT